jgi:O-antigen/teichoic acid export membrane protein
MNEILAGGIATACFVVGLFFFRFWRSSRDRFFLYFALSFWIEGANRFLLYAVVGPNEAAAAYYAIRVIAYGLIIAAIVQKNRTRPPAGPPS